MRTSHLAFLFPLAFILAAATPGDVRDKARRAVYHAQGLAMCQIAMAQGRPGDFEAADASQGCHCTIDAFMTGKTVAQLPPLDAANIRTVLKDELSQCLDSMANVGVKRLVSEPAGAGPSVPVPVAAPAPAPLPEAPATAAAPAPAAAEQATAAGFAAWLATVPLWLWAAIALAFIVFAARMLNLRGERRDLLGAPPSMRSRLSGVPRRPDPPSS